MKRRPPKSTLTDNIVTNRTLCRTESPAAKDAIAQIQINSRMCAEGHRPICQDTGIVTVFLEIGMDVRWDDATMGVEDMANEGVRRSEEHTSELQSLMRTSYAVFCLKKKKHIYPQHYRTSQSLNT